MSHISANSVFDNGTVQTTELLHPATMDDIQKLKA